MLTPGPGWEVGEGREVHRPLEARRLVPPHSPPTPWFPEHSFPPLGRSWQAKKHGPPKPRWPAESLPTAQGAGSGHSRHDWGRLGQRCDVGQLPAVGQGGWNTVWEPAPHTTLSASSCLPRPGSEGQAGSTGPLLPLRPQPLLLAGPGGSLATVWSAPGSPAMTGGPPEGSEAPQTLLNSPDSELHWPQPASKRLPTHRCTWALYFLFPYGPYGVPLCPRQREPVPDPPPLLAAGHRPPQGSPWLPGLGPRSCPFFSPSLGAAATHGAGRTLPGGLLGSRWPA